MNKKEIIDMLIHLYEVDINNCVMTHEMWIEAIAEALTNPEYLSTVRKEYQEYVDVREKMEYRTNEQFETIVSNVYNNNWTDAAQKCVEYGFYAIDLVRRNEKAIEESLEYTDDEGNVQVLYPFSDLNDIAIVIEMATKLRYDK